MMELGRMTGRCVSTIDVLRCAQYIPDLGGNTLTLAQLWYGLRKAQLTRCKDYVSSRRHRFTLKVVLFGKASRIIG